jgi:hypothetical protein
MPVIKLDLRHIFNNSRAMDDALQQAFDDVIEKKIREVEIAYGKGSDQLLKKIERFLRQPQLKKYYLRMDRNAKESGKIFVYFKF